jgi:hypothetical protein
MQQVNPNSVERSFKKMTTQILNTTPESDIEGSRIFNSGSETLFCAWSDPNQLNNCCGPKDIIHAFNEFDLRNERYSKYSSFQLTGRRMAIHT